MYGFKRKSFVMVVIFLRFGNQVESKKRSGVCRKDLLLNTVFGFGPWKESGV